MENDVLINFLENAALTCSVDEDGHIYVSEGLEFPVWVINDLENNMIVFSTFAKFNAISKNEANEFCNHVSSEILTPNFYVVSDDDTTHHLYANYVVYHDRDISPRNLIRAVTRFSAGFKLAGSYDEDDYFLP